jgi:hypothetical protein
MRGRSRKILIGIVVVAAVLGLAYGIALGRSKARLREAYAALKRDGRPMRAADLVLADIPDEQNAAPLYERAAAMLAVPLDEDVAERDLLERVARLARAMYDKPTKPHKIAEHQQKMAELKQRMERDDVLAALQIVEEGTRRPACRFEPDFTVLQFKDTAHSEPLSNNLRNFGRILAARARHEAEAGRPEKAWDTVRILLRYSDMLHDDPVSVNPWVPFATVNQACGVIRTLSETTLPDDQAYHVIEGLLRDWDDVEPLVRALDAARLLHGEKLYGLSEDELYEVLRAEPGRDAAPEFFVKVDLRKATFAPTFIADHANYLRLMAKSVQLLRGPFVPRDAPPRREIDKLRRRYHLTRKLAPMPGLMKDLHCSMVARVNMTRANLGLLRYRQTHGEFPPTLEALELEPLTDPYDGKPLRYRPESQGFIVYSVDEDQEDNGGAERQPRQMTGYDSVWRFPRKPVPVSASAQ